MSANDNNKDSNIQYKKELKILDGEERAAIKKAKGSFGKKAKDVIEQIEKDYKIKRAELEEQYHSQSTITVSNENESNNDTENNTNSNSNSNSNTLIEIQKVEQQIQLLDVNNNNTNTNTNAEKDDNDSNNSKQVISTNNKKITKYKKKKELERLNEINKQKELQNVISYRDIEYQIISAILKHYNLQISHINPDGNCLYTSIANQLNRMNHNSSTSTNQQKQPIYDYTDIRALCGTTLLENRIEFESFCELYDTTSNNTPITFEQYVTNVQTKSECWGGHLELRVLSKALHNRPIYIYSNPHPITNTTMSSETTTTTTVASQPAAVEPLVIQYDNDNTDTNTTTTNTLEPIRLSYHLHYYALGEHYNEVIPIEK